MLPKFINQSLLNTALTHRSALNEKKTSDTAESYERLEYLGDAVLELAVSEHVFHRFPTEPEGVLTSYRSALVKTETLAELAIKLKLGEKVHMSKGEERTGGRQNKSILADVFEAVVGALYLDQGFTAVVTFLTKHLFLKLNDIVENKLFLDAKSFLQEKVQALGYPAPTYRVIQAIGPDHQKQFTIEVLINSIAVATGLGSSKQQAQQQAAQIALEQFDPKLYNPSSTE